MPDRTRFPHSAHRPQSGRWAYQKANAVQTRESTLCCASTVTTAGARSKNKFPFTPIPHSLCESYRLYFPYTSHTPSPPHTSFTALSRAAFPYALLYCTNAAQRAFIIILHILAVLRHTKFSPSGIFYTMLCNASGANLQNCRHPRFAHLLFPAIRCIMHICT